MGDRLERVIYKIVVDTDDVPAELQPGANKQVGHAAQQAKQVSQQQQNNPAYNLPQSGGGGGNNGNGQSYDSRRFQQQLISQTLMVTRAVQQGIGANMRYVMGGAMGTNATTTLKGVVGLGGNVVGAVGGGMARFGGVGGAVAGLAIVGAAYMATKAVTSIIESLDRLSKTFARYNAGIAASEAQLRVATIQANIRMAQAAEPVVVAFNKLRIAAVQLGEGFVELLFRKFGPSIEHVLDVSVKWVEAVANKMGVKINLSASPASVGNMIPLNGKGTGVQFTPRLSAGEMYAATSSGSVFGGREGAAQMRIQGALLSQRNLVASLEKAGAPNSEWQSTKAYYNAQLIKLQNMERNYLGWTDSSGRHHAGSRETQHMGSPYRGPGPRLTVTDNEFGGMSKQGVLDIKNILAGTKPEQIAKVKSQIKAIEDDIRERWNPKLVAGGPESVTQSVREFFLGITGRSDNLMSVSDYNEAQRKLKALRGKLADLTPFKSSPAHVIPGAKEMSLNLSRISADVMRARKDPIIAAFENAANLVKNPNTTGANLQKAQDFVKAHSLDYVKAKGHVKELEDIEHEASKQYHQLRQDYFRKIGINKNVQGDFNKHAGPFAALDISQTVNLKMEAKLAHEKDVAEAIRQVMETLTTTMQYNRNESRLAALLQNTDKMGVV